jgi:hypothetical protein
MEEIPFFAVRLEHRRLRAAWLGRLEQLQGRLVGSERRLVIHRQRLEC